MTNQIFGRFVRTALAVAMLAGAQFAAAEVVAGTKIKLEDGPGTTGGGAFIGSVISGRGTGLSGDANYGNTFESFCLEYKEHISLSGLNQDGDYVTNPYYVASVTDHTVSGINASGPSQTMDVISSQTAWLFTQFSNTHLSDTSIWGSGSTTTKNNALQMAIWSFEDEVGYRAAPTFGANSLAQSYVNLANAAVTGPNAWIGIGNVRVLNLFSTRSGTEANYTYSGHAQDQLYMVSAVPETETYAMMLAGLGLMGAIARRRKNKTA